MPKKYIYIIAGSALVLAVFFFSMVAAGVGTASPFYPDIDQVGLVLGNFSQTGFRIFEQTCSPPT